jgi:general L-amino acid transport system permease protein
MEIILGQTRSFKKHMKAYNWHHFLADNITQSYWKMAWILFATLLTGLVAGSRFLDMPAVTILIVFLWGAALFLVARDVLFHQRSKISEWLKRHLLSSVSNSILTLLYLLVISALLRSAISWGVINATFNAEETAPEFQSKEGATWGVIWAARKLLLSGRMLPEDNWRVIFALIFIVVLWALTFALLKAARRAKIITALKLVIFGWMMAPVVLYILLVGVSDQPVYQPLSALTGTAVTLGIYILLWWQKVIIFHWKSVIITILATLLFYSLWWGIGRSGVFPPINVNSWGGLMLSLIVASCVVIGALPIAILLALGRRSKVYGIPAWITWPVAIGIALWGVTTTPQLLADARSLVEQVFAFWPILVILLAYGFQRSFKGNLVAAASTAFIELVRSVPLITVLFMGILMAPFFFKSGFSIAKPWPVIIGYILFQSAYMAEVIRGGLQAIPAGQYEAADALGYNSFQKMRFIIMPQALTIVIPALTGQFISAFKSSSLVSIVGLHDLTGIASAIINNPEWLGLNRELYVFLGIVYFSGSFVMSSYSRRLEKRLGVGER